MYRFSHALLRETLYEELSTPQRVRLHRRVGETLETVHANSIEAHLPELAHHFTEGAVTTSHRLPCSMDRNSSHHERNAQQISETRNLRQNNCADNCRGRWQKRKQQCKTGARQPGHGQLIADIGNDR